MQLVILNENTSVFNLLNVDVIKTLNGVFDVNDLQRELVNFYFNKVIIDITAIKDYFVSYNLFEFLNYFEKDKIILVLTDNDYCNSKEFLSKLIDNGFYNFTKNSQGVSYLISKSNTYEDVKKYIKPDTFTSVLSASSVEHVNVKRSTNQFIIGIQNISAGAGATTLMCKMVKQLAYNYKVKGIEVNKHDSVYFRDENIVYCSDLNDIKVRLNDFVKEEIIIIDLNDVDGEDICSEILYLVEPGIIRLNKCLVNNKNLFEKYKGDKVILNKSALKDEEINFFERETGINVFYNLGCINDRSDRLMSIDKLLIKLGFNKQEVKKGLFNKF